MVSHFQQAVWHDREKKALKTLWHSRYLSKEINKYVKKLNTKEMKQLRYPSATDR